MNGLVSTIDGYLSRVQRMRNTIMPAYIQMAGWPASVQTQFPSLLDARIMKWTAIQNHAQSDAQQFQNARDTDYANLIINRTAPYTHDDYVRISNTEMVNIQKLQQDTQDLASLDASLSADVKDLSATEDAMNRDVIQIQTQNAQILSYENELQTHLYEQQISDSLRLLNMQLQNLNDSLYYVANHPWGD